MKKPNEKDKPADLRLYVGAVAAVAGDGKRYEFVPFSGLTVSLEVAAREAGALAYRQWPVVDGWHDHAAVVSPMATMIYVEMADAAANGTLDPTPPSEKMMLFKFNEPMPSMPETIH